MPRQCRTFLNFIAVLLLAPSASQAELIDCEARISGATQPIAKLSQTILDEKIVTPEELLRALTGPTLHNPVPGTPLTSFNASYYRGFELLLKAIRGEDQEQAARAAIRAVVQASSSTAEMQKEAEGQTRALVVPHLLSVSSLPQTPLTAQRAYFWHHTANGELRLVILNSLDGTLSFYDPEHAEKAEKSFALVAVEAPNRRLPLFAGKSVAGGEFVMAYVDPRASLNLPPQSPPVILGGEAVAVKRAKPVYKLNIFSSSWPENQVLELADNPTGLAITTSPTGAVQLAVSSMNGIKIFIRGAKFELVRTIPAKLSRSLGFFSGHDGNLYLFTLTGQHSLALWNLSSETALPVKQWDVDSPPYKIMAYQRTTGEIIAALRYGHGQRKALDFLGEGQPGIRTLSLHDGFHDFQWFEQSSGEMLAFTTQGRIENKQVNVTRPFTGQSPEILADATIQQFRTTPSLRAVRLMDGRELMLVNDRQSTPTNLFTHELIIAPLPGTGKLPAQVLNSSSAFDAVALPTGELLVIAFFNRKLQVTNWESGEVLLKREFGRPEFPLPSARNEKGELVLPVISSEGGPRGSRLAFIALTSVQ